MSIAWIAPLLLVATCLPIPPAAADSPPAIPPADDGWPDISDFIDSSYGFAPLVIPITEPAIGYGAAGALVFIDKQKDEGEPGFGRPNLSAVGGLATENGTWGVMGGDTRHWLDDRLQTLAGVGYFSVNLDYYGLGEEARPESEPLSYNLQPSGGLLQAKYRLGASRFWGGIGYAFAVTQVTFEAPAETPGLPDHKSESRVGGLIPVLGFDSRDNLFTPLRGTYCELTAGLYSAAFGGDDEFQRLGLIAMQYLPLPGRLTLGVRGDATATFGDIPFYMRPFIFMRGVPAMRYQGEGVVQAEAEARWQFWKRFSLVGFGGVGKRWSEFDRFDDSGAVTSGGTGIRYELARRHGLHVGVDVAFGPDEPAIYVQFGSAWMRP